MSQRDPSQAKWLPLIFMAFMLIICGLVTQVVQQRNSAVAIATENNNGVDRQQFRDRVEFHKMNTGTAINRERMESELSAEVQRQNGLKNPESPTPTHQGSFEMAGERAQASRVQAQVPNQGLDAQITASVQSQQEAERAQHAQEQKFAREFIENAARAGYKVIVDKDLNVLSVEPMGDRGPSSVKACSTKCNCDAKRDVASKKEKKPKARLPAKAKSKTPPKPKVKRTVISF